MWRILSQPFCTEWRYCLLYGYTQNALYKYKGLFVSLSVPTRIISPKSRLSRCRWHLTYTVLVSESPSLTLTLPAKWACEQNSYSGMAGSYVFVRICGLLLQVLNYVLQNVQPLKSRFGSLIWHYYSGQPPRGR